MGDHCVGGMAKRSAAMQPPGGTSGGTVRRRRAVERLALHGNVRNYLAEHPAGARFGTGDLTHSPRPATLICLHPRGVAQSGRAQRSGR